MPSTYTTNLRLELQADGENANVWGQKTNNNIDLIEVAVAGKTSVAVSSGQVTSLTYANAATDESRAATLLLSATGTVSAPTYVVFPSISKTVWVRNNFTVVSAGVIFIMNNATATGVTATPGDWDKLVLDGTNIYAVQDGIRDAITSVAAVASAASNNIAPSQLAQTTKDLFGFRNMLINGDFQLNQRVFAGGSLTSGTYGYDRWKSWATGTNVSVTGRTVSLNGTILQIVESPRLDNENVALSIENPSGDIICAIGDGTANTTATVSATTGIGYVNVSISAAISGNVHVQLRTTSNTTFGRVQFEKGTVPTDMEKRPVGLELDLANRYYERGGYGWAGPTVTGSGQFLVVNYCTPKRGTPTLAVTSVNNTGAFGGSETLSATGTNSFKIQYTPTLTDNGQAFQGTYISDAEL